MSTRTPRQESDRSSSGSGSDSNAELPGQDNETFTSEQDEIAAETLSACTCTSKELARSYLIQAATELGAKGLNQDDVCGLAFDICSKRCVKTGSNLDGTSSCPPPQNIIREQDLEFERSAQLDQEKEERRKAAALAEDRKKGELMSKVKEAMNDREERLRRLSSLQSSRATPPCAHAGNAIGAGAEIILRFPDGYRCSPETFLTTDPMQRVIDLARLVYLDRVLTDLPPSPSSCSWHSPTLDEICTRLGGFDLNISDPDGTEDTGAVSPPNVTPLALFDNTTRRSFVDGKTDGDLAQNGMEGKTVLWVIPSSST